MVVNDNHDKEANIETHDIDLTNIDPKKLYYITDDNQDEETKALIHNKSEGILIRVYSGIENDGNKKYKYAFIRKSPLDLLWQNEALPILYKKSEKLGGNLGGKRSRKAKKQRRFGKRKSRSRK